MHIAVFSQHHTNPDCPATSRHYTLLAHLARTHRITLITTNTWERLRITHRYPWIPEGVEVRNAAVSYENKMGVGRRLLSFGRYAAYAIREGLCIDTPDVIWGISTPLTAAWAAAQVARLRGVPWVFEVQDLWPAFPIAMGAVPNKWAQRRLHQMEYGLYRSAQHIVTLSPDMSSTVTEAELAKGRKWRFGEGKVTTILNGTDLELAALATDEAVATLRQEYDLQNRRVILYAGTFGRANDIPTLLAAAEQLADDHPTLVWLFMGHGYDEPLVQAAAARCVAIRLVPPQARHAVFAWFRLADLSVVSFLGLPVLDANSPAKLYDSLAVGTPVIVTNPGWTKELVEAHNCGWYVPASNASALAERVAELLAEPATVLAAGQAGQQVAQHYFDRQQLAATMQNILEQSAKQQ
ncbi:glycosyltransferase family 4 protein [Hymenobacter profundi]|uniref:Glycosyltransferase family 4 protein n=1 Tax=Hymenobacter profundi TaxID=1982110 RepID=A0ABS6X1U3_9BACT|nr:glycosyltransferase family 4 protein [Hymenobacter profundi]MBW3129795.1 glycosyltransferase family 4 protein [Hymenobacter profundi]